MIDEKKLIEEMNKYARENFHLSDEFEWVLEGMIKALDIVERQPKVGEWIPVSERLPEKTDYPEQRYRILASCSDGIVRNATIESLRNPKEKHSSRGNEFVYVAWMPLPEPYRKDVE